MSKQATLKQAQKVLALLEPYPAEKIQALFESGNITAWLEGSDVFIAARKKLEVTNQWMLIGTLTDSRFTDIYITVPHSPHPNANGKYQVRVWKGKHGRVSNGHVDSGTAEGKLLLETFMDQPFTLCTCCWERALAEVGIIVHADKAWTLTRHGDHDILYKILYKEP